MNNLASQRQVFNTWKSFILFNPLTFNSNDSSCLQQWENHNFLSQNREKFQAIWTYLTFTALNTKLQTSSRRRQAQDTEKQKKFLIQRKREFTNKYFKRKSLISFSAIPDA